METEQPVNHSPSGVGLRGRADGSVLNTLPFGGSQRAKRAGGGYPVFVSIGPTRLVCRNGLSSGGCARLCSHSIMGLVGQFAESVCVR